MSDEYTDTDEELAMARAYIVDLEKVLRSIAQYDPRWKGQRVNDMPSRAALIATAYDAVDPAYIQHQFDADHVCTFCGVTRRECVEATFYPLCVRT